MASKKVIDKVWGPIYTDEELKMVKESASQGNIADKSNLLLHNQLQIDYKLKQILSWLETSEEKEKAIPSTP